MNAMSCSSYGPLVDQVHSNKSVVFKVPFFFVASSLGLWSGCNGNHRGGKSQVVYSLAAGILLPCCHAAMLYCLSASLQAVFTE